MTKNKCLEAQKRYGACKIYSKEEGCLAEKINKGEIEITGWTDNICLPCEKMKEMELWYGGKE